VVPLLGVKAPSFTLVKIGQGTLVCFLPDMTGEVVKGNVESDLTEMRKKGRVLQSESSLGIALTQGETIRLGMMNDTISFFIRFVPQSSKPIAAPVFDMTGSEATAVIMAVVIAVVFGVYQA